MAAELPAVIGQHRLNPGVVGLYVLAKQLPCRSLDSMDLSMALDLIQNVGLLELGGYQTAWPEARDFGVSVAEARSRVFRTLKHERPSKVIDRVYAEFAATNSGRAAKIKNAYGWFGEWLLDLQYQEASARIHETIVVRATRRKRSQPSFRNGWGLGHAT